jgi:predicted component of type VI protein secretion system
MQITLQLTEVPANEKVSSRIFTLPSSGGTFGSDFDCDIQLPDRSGQVAPKHGCFTRVKSKMMVQAYAGNKLAVQDQALAPGKQIQIVDGSTVTIGDYLVLVSIVGDVAVTSEDNDVALESPQSFNHYFSSDSLVDDDLDDNIVMKSESAEIIKEQTMAQDQTPHFASNGVFSDDPFADDPFDDHNIKLNAEATAVPTQEAFDQPKENIETFVAEDEDQDAVVFDQSLVKTPDNNDAQTTANANNQQITQLVTLLENQLTSNSELQSKIFKAIDKTLTSFLDEFSPAHLEDVFDDFTVPFFVQKEKQYWRSYRKSFKRRSDSGEYHRLFKALLLSNMQNAGENDKSDNKK